MSNEIQRLLEEIVQLKAVYDSLPSAQQPETLYGELSAKASQLAALTSGKDGSISVYNPHASRDTNISTNLIIHNHNDQDPKSEGIKELYELFEKDFYSALKKFDFWVNSGTLEDADIRKFKSYAQITISDAIALRNFIRNLGIDLISKNIDEDKIFDILEKLDLRSKLLFIIESCECANDIDIVNLFSRYGQDVRDFCVYLIKKHSIKINDEKNINQNHVIFADYRIASENRDKDLYVQSVLSYLSQRRIFCLEEVVENIEKELMAEIYKLLPYNLRISMGSLSDLRKIGVSASEELKMSKHLAIIDDLICLNSFNDKLCNIQRNQERKAWSVCISNDTLSSIQSGMLLRRYILEDIARAIANTWINLLADQPMALFALHPHIQSELGQLLHWYIPSITNLALEFHERGDAYENIQQFFTKSYASVSNIPSEQELLSWLKLRPDNCKQTWLWIIQYPPSPDYTLLLIELLPFLTRTNTWVRLVLPEQPAISQDFYWIGETQKSLEERFEHFFKLLTGDSFASQFRGEKSDAEAKQALIHLFYRSHRSFKQAIRIFLEIYKATAQRPVTRLQGRLQVSDFE